MEALRFLAQMITDLYGGAMVLRLLLQLWRADFYNPLAQTIVKITDPVLKPLRTVMPQIEVARGYKVDTASIAGVFLLHLLIYSLLILAGGRGFVFGPIVLLALLHSVKLFFGVYIFLLVIQAVLSWLGPGGSNHPAAPLLQTLNQPLLAPVQRVLPPTGGIDFSTLIVTALLYCVWLLFP